MLSLAWAGPAEALTWEKPTVSLTMEAGAGEVVAEFPFKNEGAGTVTIGELKSSCGCSTPTVKSRTIAAGEAGVMSVVYAPGDRVGLQTAHLTVTTDEAGVEPATVLLRVNIEPVLSLTPRLVHWAKADAGLARTIEIKQLSEKPVRIVEVKPANDALAVELKPGEAAGTWRLTLTPTSREKTSTTKVEIRVETGGRTLTYSVFGVVR
ncbi:MAG TPA: DUF1573 domain-containing protein [Rariglobus sp.]